VANVIQLKTRRQYVPGGNYTDGAPKTFADIQDKIESLAWRTISAKVSELEERLRKFKHALELLPDSPDKSLVIFDLTVALAKVQVELAICLSQSNEVAGGLVGQEGPERRPA
jgi:hypothetical protein